MVDIDERVVSMKFDSSDFEKKSKTTLNTLDQLNDKLSFKDAANSDSLEVCSRSSEELVNYFQTGDTNLVKLYEYQEDSEPSNTTIYLINILSDEGDSGDNSKKYAKHLAPMIVL